MYFLLSANEYTTPQQSKRKALSYRYLHLQDNALRNEGYCILHYLHITCVILQKEYSRLE